MELAMGGDGNPNNRWDWYANGNKTSLNLAAEIGIRMNNWERERMELKKTLSSSLAKTQQETIES